MTAPPVQLAGVRVTARGRTILDVPQLAVAAGSTIAICGPNGAGKTTLLRVCAGFCRPAAGRVAVLGREVTTLGAWGLTRLRCDVGYLPQEAGAHGQMPLTVREIVAIGRTGRAGLFHPLQPSDWELVDAVITDLGLHALRAAPFARLSGGEQRRVLLARALVQSPQVLLLDEPTAHLDLGARESLVAILDRLGRTGSLTVLLACHEPEVLPPCCRRVVWLESGRVAADGTPEDVLTDARVQKLYGPGLRVWHNAGRHAVLPAAEAHP